MKKKKRIKKRNKRKKKRKHGFFGSSLIESILQLISLLFSLNSEVKKIQL